MLKRLSALIAVLIVGVGSLILRAETSLDSERLDLEIRMQARVEEALGKILPVGQFVVVIRVEPLPTTAETAPAAQTENDGFYLPGVPVRRGYENTGEQIKNLADSLRTSPQRFQRFVRRIRVTLVLDDQISDDVVTKVRELTRQMLSLDAERGDTLDIQRTAFNKAVEQQFTPTGIYKFQREVRSYWVLISLVLILAIIGIFFLFMFGPLRGFLNNFVQILPTLKREEARGLDRMPDFGAFGGQFMPPMYGAPGGAIAAPSSFSGSLQVENPNKTTLPFGFIREDHISNLAVLLARETPEKAAVVLGYLPPDWISRVLARMDPAMQTEIAASLATTRQLLPEQVEDIEQDLRRRLDYLIGGPDRIFAVYDSLEPEAQKRMLESLRESRPEIADELRHRTVAFADLEKLESAALKALMREVDLQTLVQSLKGAGETFRSRVLEHVPAGKAEIIREELEMSEGTGGRATLDAQRKVVNVAKRLEREGQIKIPQVTESIPATRYGQSLRQTLRLPPGLKFEDTLRNEGSDSAEPKSGDINDRIRRFKNRRNDSQERFPDDGSVGGPRQGAE